MYERQRGKSLMEDKVRLENELMYYRHAKEEGGDVNQTLIA